MAVGSRHTRVSVRLLHEVGTPSRAQASCALGLGGLAARSRKTLANSRNQVHEEGRYFLVILMKMMVSS